MRRSWFVYACAVLSFLILLLGARSAEATWSIVVADSVTGEVAIGSVTCTSGDLHARSPVMLVGIGCGVVQAGGDNGVRVRKAIRDGLLKGTPPQEIMEIVNEIGGWRRRQVAIVDTLGRAATFTGNNTSEWAGGVTGTVPNTNDSIVYAIQGNILAGPCVVPAIKDALDETEGDMAKKLMAAMEAAHAAGGDGRCSCDPTPTSCGCPPPGFTRSGLIGYMIVARIGDINDADCNADGCADGDYFMNFNYADKEFSDPDPTSELRRMFDEWRVTLVGHPDAVQSVVNIASAGTTPAGDDVFEMTIQLNDWNKDNVTVGVLVTVEHETDSDGISSIGTVIDNGNGEFSVPLTIPAGSIGMDRFLITADDVILTPTPSPELSVGGGGGGTDADGDGFFAPPDGSDCDDNDPSVNPGATEVCTDGVDNNCNGLTDGDDPDCVDNDNDGFFAPLAGSDCDDNDPSVNPGATEDCADGIDNDCDSLTDSIDPDCGAACKQKNEVCSLNTECCSGKCRKGKCVGGSASASSTLTAWKITNLTQLAAGNFCPLFPSFYSTSFPKGTSRPTMKDAIPVDGGIALPSARE